MRLFLAECRRLLHSAVYWLTVLALVFFLLSQGVLPDDKRIEEPQPGEEQSVLVPSGDPALIMPEAVSALYEGFLSNSFSGTSPAAIFRASPSAKVTLPFLRGKSQGKPKSDFAIYH